MQNTFLSNCFSFFVFDPVDEGEEELSLVLLLLFVFDVFTHTPACLAAGFLSSEREIRSPRDATVTLVGLLL